MSDVIYQVKIISDSMSVSDWMAIASLVISSLSVSLVIYNHIHSEKEKELNLTFSLKNRQYEIHKEMAYLYCTFSNNSSRSINIDELYLTDGSPTEHFTDTEHWLHEGGTCVFESVTFNSTFINDTTNTTMSIPITIPPHSSVAGYIAFYAGAHDSYLISQRLSLYLQIFIDNRHFEFELSTAANMSDYSYKISKNKIERIYRQQKHRY